MQSERSPRYHLTPEKRMLYLERQLFALKEKYILEQRDPAQDQ